MQQQILDEWLHGKLDLDNYDSIHGLNTVYSLFESLNVNYMCNRVVLYVVEKCIREFRRDLNEFYSENLDVKERIVGRTQARLKDCIPCDVTEIIYMFKEDYMKRLNYHERRKEYEDWCYFYGMILLWNIYVDLETILLIEKPFVAIKLVVHYVPMIVKNNSFDYKVVHTKYKYICSLVKTFYTTVELDSKILDDPCLYYNTIRNILYYNESTILTSTMYKKFKEKEYDIDLESVYNASYKLIPSWKRHTRYFAFCILDKRWRAENAEEIEESEQKIYNIIMKTGFLEIAGNIKLSRKLVNKLVLDYYKNNVNDLSYTFNRIVHDDSTLDMVVDTFGSEILEDNSIFASKKITCRCKLKYCKNIEKYTRSAIGVPLCIVKARNIKNVRNIILCKCYFEKFSYIFSSRLIEYFNTIRVY
jgi:hypothetical protein